MRLDVLYVPECPNLALLELRIDQALAGRGGRVTLTHRVVTDAADAAHVGMTGSPTLLIDGVDPFAESGQPPSLSCRLYRDEDGRTEGAPSVAQLRQALTGSALAREDGDRPVDESALSGAASSTLSSWRERAAPTDDAERAVHRVILRTFATTGRPPTSSVLDDAATPFDEPATQVLHRLHAADVIRLDTGGRIRVAYPFSAVPTRHRVRLTSGVEAYAMCVIDALGMPAMLTTDAAITTTDPSSGAPISVTNTEGQTTWMPSTAVVFVGGHAAGGPSAECCCDYLNAFSDRSTAQSWALAHPHIPGEIINHADAERLGRRTFGKLLA